MAKAGYSS